MKRRLSPIDALPGLLLGTTIIVYAATMPLTWTWLDPIRDWGLAANNLRQGIIPLTGTNIVGVGNNGPLLFWIYQLALSIYMSSWTLPILSTLLAMIATLWTAYLLRPSSDGQDSRWQLLLVISSPIAF